MSKVLLLEGFYGGSHKEMIDLIKTSVPCKVATLKPKKWHWQMRLGGYKLSQQIDDSETFDVLFATSTFSLPELLSLKPNLATAHKILYFHENQIEYPKNEEKERDFQFGWIQILSCMVADEIWFNSKWNMDSFLNNLDSYMNKTPDRKPKGLKNQFIEKSSVVYYPINIPIEHFENRYNHIIYDQTEPIHIVWPHRWEFDKDPDTFINVLKELKRDGISFKLSLIGEQYEEVPQCLVEAKELFKEELENYGYLEDKNDYYRILLSSDICVSTAIHEFFGVSMIEAGLLGCLCLCPNRLSYPEIFPREQLYNTPAQLKKMLKNYCKNPSSVRERKNRREIQDSLLKFEWNQIKETYIT